ncbi:helix-turn-helix domain-containing protein [Nocardia mangyaensis]|uniref:helix-turn-helix domain-containing protein n=1 Tax=Nocardia mangyaensis TaxID=2213200 RepID=UPI002676D899|nr:helix-turn-helix transcriptional regulator [Nocardia mangyaensis]MDO3647630.1 helix-turn-helix transcriptional regulator [Nocardia mangyaensis]
MASPQGVTGSTMPRRQLGRHLRDLRNRARMTTRTAAAQLEWSEAKIWRIETGQTSLRSLDVEAMCKVYGAPADLVEPLAALARETKARGWWTGYGDVIAEGFEVYIGLEEAATGLSLYEDGLIPVLLQTEDYAAALLEQTVPGLTEAELERRLRVLRARQALLTRAESPLRVHVVLAEAVLTRRIGDHKVVAAQRARLRELAESDTVRIQVVPADTGYHAGLESGRFVILDFGVDDSVDRPEPPVVYVETFAGSAYLDKPNDHDRFRDAFADIVAAASGEV